MGIPSIAADARIAAALRRHRLVFGKLRISGSALLGGAAENG